MKPKYCGGLAGTTIEQRRIKQGLQERLEPASTPALALVQNKVSVFHSSFAAKVD